MEFDDSGRIAGDVGSVLNSPSTRAVLSAFGDGVLSNYGLDIREHRSYMSPAAMRSLRTFVKDMGEDDAITAVTNFFRAPYGGYWKGRPLGTSFFTKRYRYVAMQMLVE